MEGQLVEPFFEPFSIVILLVLKLVESLLVRVHLVSVISLPGVHHLIMVTHHLVDLILVVPLHFFFVLEELLIPVVVLDFFIFNLRC